MRHPELCGRTLLFVVGVLFAAGSAGQQTPPAQPAPKAATSAKPAKKRAVIAVARKLAVLLHRLWVSGEAYEPLRNQRQVALPAAA